MIMPSISLRELAFQSSDKAAKQTTDFHVQTFSAFFFSETLDLLRFIALDALPRLDPDPAQ